MEHKLNFFGPDARFHHVGIAVRSISDTCPGIEQTIDPIQGVAVAFAEIEGLSVEFVQPAKDGSPVDESLRNGIKLIHICIEVPELTSALSECQKHGFRRISSPVPATAFDQRHIVWVYSNTYGLFELLENPPCSSRGEATAAK